MLQQAYIGSQPRGRGTHGIAERTRTAVRQIGDIVRRLSTVSDFEPTTDFPESIDGDDAPVVTEAGRRDAAVQQRRRVALRVLTVLVIAALLALGYPLVRTVIAVASGYLILATGIKILGAFARPIPDAPPPGELRRVKLTYRCSSCGTELRLTLANDTVPTPPRHCADEMELITNLEDIL
jgi:hypothetical protein